MDSDDLHVLSALCQDAVFPGAEMTFLPRERRFALLLNRFRWEDPGQNRHKPERVQSVLVFDNVLRVASQGVDRGDSETVYSVLSLTWEPGEDADGRVLITLAGDGAIRLEAEALEASLRDVTRPYVAPSGQAPHHRD
ncbi:MAG: hypothetical protein CSA70_06440 [Rhodobacterales bacterium]|nr:MAG: hypothetical protein CSA70_06440 [Rhodobacterales bacterium]